MNNSSHIQDILGNYKDKNNAHLISGFFSGVNQSAIWKQKLKPLLYKIKSGTEKETDWEIAPRKTIACFRKNYVFLFDSKINPKGLSFSNKNNKPDKIYANNITPVSEDVIKFIEENYQQHIKIPIDDFISIGNNWFKQPDQTTAKFNIGKKIGFVVILIVLFKILAVLMRLGRSL